MSKNPPERAGRPFGRVIPASSLALLALIAVGMYWWKFHELGMPSGMDWFPFLVILAPPIALLIVAWRQWRAKR